MDFEEDSNEDFVHILDIEKQKLGSRDSKAHSDDTNLFHDQMSVDEIIIIRVQQTRKVWTRLRKDYSFRPTREPNYNELYKA